MDNYAEIKVELPVTQFVKLEAKAKENFHSADTEASFLLSKWVLSTQKETAKAKLKPLKISVKGARHG